MAARLQLDDRAIVRGYKAGLSSVVLGRKFGCWPATILRLVHKAGVTVRAWRQRQVPDAVKFDGKKLTELIDGLLLGDGCISRDCPGRVVVGQHPSRIGWLRLIQRQLATIGIRSSISKPRTIEGGHKVDGRRFKDTISVRLVTPVYDIIEAHYARWYPGGKKRVPADLRLTPIVLMHWFCGDGSARRAELQFATNGFSHREVDRLAAKLSRYGFSGARRRSSQTGPIIWLNADATRKFKREIQRRLPGCCRYKLRKVTPKPERMGHPGRLTRRTVHAIRYGDLKSARYRNLLAVHKVNRREALRIRAGKRYAGYDLGSPW